MVDHGVMPEDDPPVRREERPLCAVEDDALDEETFVAMSEMIARHPLLTQ